MHLPAGHVNFELMTDKLFFVLGSGDLLTC